MKAGTTTFLRTGLLSVAIIIVTVNAGLAFRAVQSLDENQVSVAHTWQVIDSVERVMSLLKDAESGSRGFLITGEKPYLEPYVLACRDLPAELSRLGELISDNPHQISRVTEMRAVIEMRLQLLQRGIDERAEGSLSSVRHVVLSGTGKYEMDEVRSIAAAMQAEEQSLLTQRRNSTLSASRRARATLLVASTLDLLLIVLVSWYFVRERNLRLISEEAEHRLQMLQTISDVALTQLPIGDLTAELLKRVRNVIGADATVLATWRDGEMIVEAANGLAIEPGTRLGTGEDDPLRRAALENRVTVVDYPHSMAGKAPADAAAARPFAGVNGGGEAATRLRTLLIIPLSASAKREVTGVLVAGRHSPHAFEVADEELLRVVADRIAIARDRVAAYEAERTARRLAEENAGKVRALNAELEQRVLQRTSELEGTNKELEAFSYSVSHDLRAPLRTVDGFSRALQEDYGGALDETGLDFVRRIRDGVQRMGQLIDALLQLSRITRAELTWETVDLSAMVSELAEELRQQNPDRRIEFEIQTGLKTRGDPRLLRVGLENLLGNAVKFTGKQAESRIAVGQSSETGEFYIRDNGAGFDMQYASKLFNAFQRLHGEKDFKGSGIGLATVARVIRRHHGSIRAEGLVEGGATFWFKLG